MGKYRERAIARSIIATLGGSTSSSAIVAQQDSSSLLARLLFIISSFFKLYALVLHKMRAREFARLRGEIWGLNEADYVGSFVPRASVPSEMNEKRNNRDEFDCSNVLKSIGDMGFSGSVSLLPFTFFFFSNEQHRTIEIRKGIVTGEK